MKLTKWMGCILTLALLLALGGGFFLAWGLGKTGQVQADSVKTVYVPVPAEVPASSSSTAESSSQEQVAADFSELGEWMAHIPTYEGYAGITPIYKKPSLPNAGELSAIYYPNYSNDALPIHDFVMGILCAVPLYPIEDTGYPKNMNCVLAKSEALQLLIYFGNQTTSLFVLQKTPDEPTTFVLERDFGAERHAFVSKEPVMDIIREMIRPYTLEAAKIASDQFVAALENKDLSTLTSMANPNNVLVNEWAFLHSTTKISQVKKEIIEEYETNGKYRVSFYLEGAECAPFLPGHNERILEIDYGYDTSPIYARHFIEEDKFMHSSNPAEKAVADFIEWVTTEPFADGAAIPVEKALEYILYCTPTPQEGGFTQEQMDAALQKYFAIASVTQGEGAHYYDAKNKRYVPWGRDSQPPNARITGSQFQEDGSCTVTAEFYRDGLQTLVEKRMVYSLQKNPDETYRFVRAELID